MNINNKTLFYFSLLLVALALFKVGIAITWLTQDTGRYDSAAYFLFGLAAFQMLLASAGIYFSIKK